MSRNFPDFLTAYQQYADDKFVPPDFNTWTGLSILAGALERRVWLPWSDTFSYYPNIYVLLVSKPGVGKSVALKKGVDILQDVNRRTSTLNIMPSQVTEAKFIELMGHGRSFTYAFGTKELIIFQNAGYYFASEASNSLRNIFGEFIACLTDFYDCPDYWERATKKDGKRITLKNVCMNMLAGSTFDYLGKLVNDENIQGGFASRLLYIQCRDKLIREQPFQMGLTDAHIKDRQAMRESLVQDLAQVNSMVGPMRAEPEFAAAWEEWYPKAEEKRQSYESEKLQSILARTNTNVLKVSMLLSASESGDRVLRLRHWEKAVALVEGVNQYIPSIFLEARANQGPGAGGDTLTAAIIQEVLRSKRISRANLEYKLHVKGHNEVVLKKTIDSLLGLGRLSATAAHAGVGVILELGKDANNDL